MGAYWRKPAPQEPALLTFRELSSRVAALSAPPEEIGILVPNPSAEHVLQLLAAGQLRCTVVRSPRLPYTWLIAEGPAALPVLEPIAPFAIGFGIN
jgi:hypothetical protein